MGSLLSDAAFRVAFVVAVVGATAVWWWATRRTPVSRFAPPFAAVTVVAALAGLRAEHHLTFPLVLGLSLMALATVALRARAGALTGGLAAVAGAAILVSDYPTDRAHDPATWIVAATAITMVVAVPVLEVCARRWGRLTPVVLLLGVLGVYLCVPDTEYVRPLLAAAVVTAFLARLPPGAVSALGSGVVVAYLVWCVPLEGVGRPGAVVGALGCVMALALFPAWPTEQPWPAVPVAWWVRAGTALVLVVWCSRVAGLVDPAWLAATVAAGGFAVAGVVRLTVRPGGG